MVARLRTATRSPRTPLLSSANRAVPPQRATGCGRMYLDNRPVVRGGAVAVPATPPQAARTGSLWRDNVSANYLFSDVKARYPGAQADVSTRGCF